MGGVVQPKEPRAELVQQLGNFTGSLRVAAFRRKNNHQSILGARLSGKCTDSLSQRLERFFVRWNDTYVNDIVKLGRQASLELAVNSAHPRMLSFSLEFWALVRLVHLTFRPKKSI